MTTAPSQHEENLAGCEQRSLTQPSREVQRLLKTAGPVRPDVKDLEEFGTRKTRGNNQNLQTRSMPSEIAHQLKFGAFRHPSHPLLSTGHDSESSITHETKGRAELFGAWKIPDSEIISNLKEIEDRQPLNAADESINFSPTPANLVQAEMGNPKSRCNKQASRSESVWKIRCICDDREDGADDSEVWIQCDDCENWQHNICMGISTNTHEMPKRYRCQACKPSLHRELLDAIDRSERPWEVRRQEYEAKLVEEDIHKGQLGRGHGVEGEKNVTESVSTFFPLTNECHHYTQRKDIDWDLQKYWDQRYSLFSRYDEGIYMTNDSWFGVTPEPVALKVADDLSGMVLKTKTVLVDLFAGAGGNTIAFALSGRWTTVISIEKDPSVIACAQRNASIYGVSDRIKWINGDCFSYLSANSSTLDSAKTVIFASPPWGGPGYRTDKVFNLYSMQPYSVKKIHDAVREMDAALFLPRTSDLGQIARLAPEGKKVEVVQYCMEGASKGLVAYIPGAI